MYESHWNLSRKPFDTGCDPEFYYPSENHQTTLLKLRYAIENRQGAAALIGEAGLGKTLLVRALMEQLGDEFQPRTHLVYPRLSARELLGYVYAEVTGQSAIPASRNERISGLQEALAANTDGGRHAVWVIDEAHLLRSPSSYETIRLLTNFQSTGQPDWTIVLCGQLPLVTELERHPGLDERLAVKCHLHRFSIDETIGYILHRMRIAGSESRVFSDTALEAVHEFSHGVPRRIHRLCDLALLLEFANGGDRVSRQTIETVAEELGFVHPIAT